MLFLVGLPILALGGAARAGAAGHLQLARAWSRSKARRTSARAPTNSTLQDSIARQSDEPLYADQYVQSLSTAGVERQEPVAAAAETAAVRGPGGGPEQRDQAPAQGHRRRHGHRADPRPRIGARARGRDCVHRQLRQPRSAARVSGRGLADRRLSSKATARTVAATRRAPRSSSPPRPSACASASASWKASWRSSRRRTSASCPS